MTSPIRMATSNPPATNVDDLVVQSEIEHNIGVGFSESWQDRLDIGSGGRSKGVDAHDARRSLAIAAHLPDGVAELGHRRPHASQKVLAGVGQRDAPGRPVEQPDPDPLFEAAQHLAQCGRRNAKRFRRAAEAQQFCDSDERPQLIVVSARQ